MAKSGMLRVSGIAEAECRAYLGDVVHPDDSRKAMSTGGERAAWLSHVAPWSEVLLPAKVDIGLQHIQPALEHPTEI